MRIKRGLSKNRKHKQVLSRAKGYRLSYRKSYRRAREALLHAGQYSYADRKKRPGQFRKLWIVRINAALSKLQMKYSQFINALKVKNIQLDRKVLSSIALDNPKVFETIVSYVK